MSLGTKLALVMMVLAITFEFSDAFTTTRSSTVSSLSLKRVTTTLTPHYYHRYHKYYSSAVTTTSLQMAQVSEKEAKVGIDKVVNALRKDKKATSELGKLTKVNNVLGFGSPKAGVLAVRFNASFQKGGMGRSSVPLPFGLGQSNKSEGRGTMVGQVKASINTESGKLLSCSVFRDLGYGRAFELKV